MPISLNKTQNVTTQQPVLQSSKPEENKSKISQVSTQTKVLVGTGLAALAVAGIYIATKGKSKPKNIKTDTNLAETVNTINEMTLDEFRQAGHKLSRGKAYTSNGELYTGSLKYTRKNGLKYVLEYENGLLVKNTPVIMSEKDFEKLGNKIVDGVAYTADGQKFTGFVRNGWQKYVNGKQVPDGTGGKKYFYNEKGLSSVQEDHGSHFITTLSKTLEENVLQISSENAKSHIVYYPGSKTPQYVTVQKRGNDFYKVYSYDKNGKKLGCYQMPLSLELPKSRGNSSRTIMHDSFNYTLSLERSNDGKAIPTRRKLLYKHDDMLIMDYTPAFKDRRESIYLNNYKGSRYQVVIDKKHGQVPSMTVKKDNKILTKETDSKLYDEVIQKAKDLKTELIAEAKQLLRIQNDVISKSKIS